MAKTIWIVYKYAMPPHLESRLRAIKFAQYFTEAGYDVILFGSSVMHNMDMNLIEDGSKYIRKQYGPIDFVHINTWMYSKTSKIKRVISDFLFFYRVAKYARDFKKPDYIIATGGPMILPNPILRFAKTNNIPYIKESLDVWPDDFVDFGLISARNPIMKLLFARTKSNSAKADALVYSWSGCYEYLRKKKWDKDNGGPIDLNKVFYINNGVDLNDFENNKIKYQLNDPDLHANYKRIVYLGSIRLVNNVMQLVYAAEMLKDREDVKFLIYGDGVDREKIISYCRQKHLTNIIVKDTWIDPKYVPFVLSQSYINVLNYISSDFAKNGISSSKLFQYMAAGKPILCNINIYNCPISENDIGIARELKTPEEYARAIIQLLSLSSEEYTDMCSRVQDAAKQYDYKYLTAKMMDVLNKF
ncbi:glycosyltransferase family 4 protein [Butyricimonas virosa]|uniref:glycosyltransferase family 4 protein n=2 Tax=Butyricimonas virosa TaxID=544645 RepID=UPI002431296D|nr:glycosyltransferase family 4 protein [Butyricimonas virosa]